MFLYLISVTFLCPKKVICLLLHHIMYSLSLCDTQCTSFCLRNVFFFKLTVVLMVREIGKEIERGVVMATDEIEVLTDLKKILPGWF